MRIKDYFGAVGSKPLVFGLAWDVTDGVNIDLDASAILLSGDTAGRQLVDVRCLSPLTSSPLGLTPPDFTPLGPHPHPLASQPTPWPHPPHPLRTASNTLS